MLGIGTGVGVSRQLVGGGGNPGVDPSTDGDVTAVWDYANALTDVDGVYQITADVGPNMAQANGSLKPALAANGVVGDGIDDELQTANSTLVSASGYCIVMGIKTPASIATDSPNSYANELIFAIDTARLAAGYFRSTGPVIGAGHYSSPSYAGVETSVALDTWTPFAVRYTTGTIGISFDGVTWAEAAKADISGLTSEKYNLLRRSATTTATMAYVAVMNAHKSDAEVQDFLAWITANKIP